MTAYRERALAGEYEPDEPEKKRPKNGRRREAREQKSKREQNPKRGTKRDRQN